MSSICIPFCEEGYDELIKDPLQYRQHVDQVIKGHPELFPPEIVNGYKMKDLYFSIKCELWTNGTTLRNINIKIN